jgi:hypothetical protein
MGTMTSWDETQQIVGRERRERVSQLAWCGEGCFDSRRRVNSTVRALRWFQKRQTGSDARFLLTKNQKRVTIHRRSNKSLDRSANSGLLIDNLRLSTLRARPVNSTVMPLTSFQNEHHR